MQGGVIELAVQAAAAARAERGTRGAARLPARRYRGVMRRGDMYVAEIMDAAGLRPVWLGSYATPEEAAYAYDAATRIMHGNKAKPNFPEPPAPAPAAGRGGGALAAAHAGVLPLVGHARMRGPLLGQQPAPPHQASAALVGHARMRAPLLDQQPAAGGGGGVPAAHAGVLPLVGHARMRAPLFGQQPAPPQGPAAPVGGGAQRQPFSVQHAPPASHFLAPPVPYHCGAAPAFSQFLYRPASGPAFAAAGGSNGAGFYGMAPMIGPEPELLMLNYAAISAMSSSGKKNKAVADAVIIIESDSDGEAVVEDNFSAVDDGGASTSSAARPAVPPLRLKDLMEAEVVRRSADEEAP